MTILPWKRSVLVVLKKLSACLVDGDLRWRILLFFFNNASLVSFNHLHQLWNSDDQYSQSLVLANVTKGFKSSFKQARWMTSITDWHVSSITRTTSRTFHLSFSEINKLHSPLPHVSIYQCTCNWLPHYNPTVPVTNQQNPPLVLIPSMVLYIPAAHRF